MLLRRNGECTLWANNGVFLSVTRQHLPHLPMLNIMICTYLFSLLCCIRYSSVHGGRYYRTTFVIIEIFFHAGNWEEGDLAVGATEVKQNHSLKIETVDPNPEEACCETPCARVKLQPAERFFVASLSLSFTHSVTPLHALALGCFEPSRGFRGGGAG